MNILDIDFWERYDINKDAVSKYIAFISNLKKLGQRNLDYSENHHIVPISVDSTLKREPANIICVSGAEHFQAHRLLLLCFNGPAKSSMYYSYNLMCNSLHNNNYNITAEDYEFFRKDFRSICSENNKGKKNPRFGIKLTEEEKQKLRGPRASKQGKNNPMYGVDRKGSKNPRFGKKHTDETKQKISESSKDRCKGWVWLNNGITNKFISANEIDTYIELGYTNRGCLMKKKNK